MTEHVGSLLVAALRLALGAVPACESCAIVGDSVAVGVGGVMAECLVDAKNGISSADIIARVHPADVLFVSAGEAMNAV